MSRTRFRPPLSWSLVVAAIVATAGLLRGGLFDPPAPAGAAVEHGAGFHGVVDGYRSWFGSYRLGGEGEVWCVDHGIRAPDVVLGYEPTGLDDRAPDTRRAIAWAVGRHGPGADRVGAAALMLVLHDLMGARYPSGPLSVDQLAPDRLQGFDGLEGEVVARARSIKADAVARAALVGPFRLAVSATEVLAGRRGNLEASVVDAGGRPVSGVAIHPAVTGAALVGDVDQVTAADGRATWAFDAAPGANTFDLSASAPGAELRALRPTVGPAQRVARPATVALRVSTAFDGQVPRRLSVHKSGDGGPTLPVTGAEFVVEGHEQTPLVVTNDGLTESIEVLPGRYTVTEVRAPIGYEPAGPWTVEITDHDVVLEVSNAARRGRLRIEKVDALTGQPVTGATFEVRGDLDGDHDAFEVGVDDINADLLPGRYQVREVSAPPGYALADDPVVVEVRARETAVATIADHPLVSIVFEKSPALAGATFAVTTAAGDRVVGRCTTDADGKCSVGAGAIGAGTDFCWQRRGGPARLAGGRGRLPDGADRPRQPPRHRRPRAADPAADHDHLDAPTYNHDHAPLPTSTTITTVAPSIATAPPPVVAASPPVGRPPATELPRTGASLRRLTGIGLALCGVGLGAVASSEASSSGRRDRRGRRRRPRAAGGRRCRS